jgi:homoserine O-acetyltransferase
MDLHDVARGRGDVSAALARISVPVLAIGIRSDTLYWPAQQRELVDRLQAAGTPAEYREIDSPHGHDAFLIDIDQVADAVSPFLARVEKAET